MTLYKYLFKDLINNQINQTVLMLYGQVYLHIIRFRESRSYFYCFKISKNLKKFWNIYFNKYLLIIIITYYY